MADRNPTDPARSPPRTPDEERAEMDEKSVNPETGVGQGSRRRPARPDPKTGEVRAGPGDAGLEDRPEINAGSSGTEQMSNRRLGIGLGIAALLTLVVFIFASIF